MYIAFVINNYTIWNNLANVNANGAAHPGTTFPGTSDTVIVSHGGFSEYAFYYLDCMYNSSCTQVNEPAAQAFPIINQLSSTDDRGPGQDTRIQVDNWNIYDNSDTLAATVSLNWDPWDTTNCPDTGSVHDETYCRLSNAMNGADGYFTCEGSNGYNCDLSMYSASYGGQSDPAEVLHDYELAMETLVAVLSDDPTMAIVTALIDIIEGIYEYFDVHAYGTIVVTLTHDVPCNLPSGTNCGYPFGINYPACSFVCTAGEECNYVGSDICGSYVGTCETCTSDCSFSNSCGYGDGCGGTCTGCDDGSACEPNTVTGYGYVCASALNCSGTLGNWSSQCNINSCYYSGSEFCATCTGGAPDSGTPVTSCDDCDVYNYSGDYDCTVTGLFQEQCKSGLTCD